MLSGIKFIPKSRPTPTNDDSTDTTDSKAKNNGDRTTATSSSSSQAAKHGSKELLAKTEYNRLQRKRLLEEAATDDDDVDDFGGVAPSYSKVICDNVARMESSTERQGLVAKETQGTGTASNRDAAALLRQQLLFGKAGSNHSSDGSAPQKDEQTYDMIQMREMQQQRRTDELSKRMKMGGESMSVQELVAAERLESSQSRGGKGSNKMSVYDQAFATSIIQNAKSVKNESAADSDDEPADSKKKKRDRVVDDSGRTSSGGNKYEDIHAGGRYNDRQSRKQRLPCDYCRILSSGSFRGSENMGELIAESRHWLLCLKPQHLSITELHCVLIPKEHSCSVVQIEDTSSSDLICYKRTLFQLYSSMGLTPLFMETALEFERFPHAIIDIVPVNTEQLIEAIAAFKMVCWRCIMAIFPRVTFATVCRLYNRMMSSSQATSSEYFICRRRSSLRMWFQYNCRILRLNGQETCQLEELKVALAWRTYLKILMSIVLPNLDRWLRTSQSM
jgi:hypothetical protein